MPFGNVKAIKRRDNVDFSKKLRLPDIGESIVDKGQGETVLNRSLVQAAIVNAKTDAPARLTGEYNKGNSGGGKAADKAFPKLLINVRIDNPVLGFAKRARAGVRRLYPLFKVNLSINGIVKGELIGLALKLYIDYIVELLKDLSLKLVERIKDLLLLLKELSDIVGGDLIKVDLIKVVVDEVVKAGVKVGLRVLSVYISN